MERKSAKCAAQLVSMNIYERFQVLEDYLQRCAAIKLSIQMSTRFYEPNPLVSWATN